MKGKEWLQKIRQNPKLLLIVCLGIGLMLILFPSFGKKEQRDVSETSLDLKQETEEYCTALTDELTELLSQMEGVGRIKLFLTFENGVEYAYLKEEKENTDLRAEDQSRDYSETYLFVEDASGNRKALAVQRILPKVKGAAVVCEGGADILVKQQIIEFLRTALDVSAASISVSPLA